MQFDELDLIPDVRRALDEMGFEEPTQVQAQVIPPLLAGQDVIAQAKTGTGKTAAFGIPIIQQVDPDRPDIQALVLTPTRELAVQVAGEIGRIAQFRPIRVVPVYGGQPISRQLRALKAGAQVVIGTPGRVLDHLGRGTIDFQQVKTLILDEADEMLDLGFLEDVEAILRQTPPNRQTALFSATMPMAILRLTDRYMRTPERIQLSRPRGLTVPQTRQRYYVVPSERLKLEALCQVLDLTEPQAAIIFCATKRGVDHLAVALKGRGYDAEPIHGDLNQAQRDKVMKAFREHRTELLIATDVAARGLDIEGLSHVFNYDMP
ncbi:MAG TPA: DEAD/DEAH box helicase, partial [Dehalococcoidia bacterium]|nr:DEAD/DEAH box helicase [Dehalococcoidia bacterium]